MKTITFNELRRIKDSLPTGSMHRIADELNLSVETVRNFFGGQNFKQGESVGIHLEPGPDGGLVMLDDTTVLDKALLILKESAQISLLTARSLHSKCSTEKQNRLWSPSLRKRIAESPSKSSNPTEQTFSA